VKDHGSALGRWSTQRLGDLLIRHNEIIHPGDRKDGEATFVGLEHIEPNTGRRIGSVIVDLGNLTGRKPTFRRGQIVYGYLRPYLNKVWVADFDGCSSVDQFAFDVRQDVADTDFIAAFMRSETFLRRSETVTTTGQLPRIGVDEIAAVSIDLPAIDDQRRIVAELRDSLTAADAARRATEDRLAAAESLLAAYLREVFEGQEAGGWKPRRLGELLVRHNDVIHPGDRAGGEAAFVGLEHIEPNTGRRIGSGIVDFANLTGRKPTFCRGQIVYGYLRPYLNKVWIAEFDGCSSVDQFAFEVRRDVADTNFVCAYMRSPTFLRRSQVVTTTGQLPRIGIDEIEAVPIELPPTLLDQRRIASQLSLRLEAVDALVTHCRGERAAVDALPASLLRAAFDGAS
jgi:type I restriction enzyme S subunit